MVEMNLQFFGGRGASYNTQQNESISEFGAKVYYNAAKHNATELNETVKKDRKFEKIIQTNDMEYIKNIQTQKEARKLLDYIRDRQGENDRKLARLGSAEAAFKEQKLAIEHRKLLKAYLAADKKLEEWREKPKPLDTTLFHKQTTTTYENARRRRMKNFDSWFFGSGGKK